MERTNVVFNQNGTVSFQEIRHIEPLPDIVWVPNIPYLVSNY